MSAVRAISIHTPLAGSDHGTTIGCDTVEISIHTPLAGSDRTPVHDSNQEPISIHTPLAGSDVLLTDVRSRPYSFQSTLPLRGVTDQRENSAQDYEFQSTLPLRGVTQNRLGTANRNAIFQSTLPLRGVTTAPRRNRRKHTISIHTPLAGSDAVSGNGSTTSV